MIEKPRNRPGPDGEPARRRLVAAAVDLFGRKGFDGVGARELTSAAGTALAAIPYHFGTKEALYLAALQEVRMHLASAIGPAALAAQSALNGTPAEARQALAVFQGALLDVIAVDPASESWAKLLIREHLDPGAGFDLVYEDAARGAVELMASLIGRATGRNPEDNTVLIEAFAAMGEVLVFRVTRNAAMRRLGWSALGEEEADTIRGALGWVFQRRCGPLR